MYVRYPTQCAPINVATGNNSFAQDIPDILLQWNAQDPPSPFEINRNNTIASNQGNRNPFIDNPYLATLIWNGPQATDSWNVLSTYRYNTSRFTVYPTQTTNWVNVTNSTLSAASFKVFTSSGQQLQENLLQNKVDFSNYANGIYILQILDGRNTETFKIIKQ